jgi:hypothetical protein
MHLGAATLTGCAVLSANEAAPEDRWALCIVERPCPWHVQCCLRLDAEEVESKQCSLPQLQKIEWKLCLVTSLIAAGVAVTRSAQHSVLLAWLAQQAHGQLEDLLE